jgi:hypothetical protein
MCPYMKWILVDNIIQYIVLDNIISKLLIMPIITNVHYTSFIVLPKSHHTNYDCTARLLYKTGQRP